MVESNLPTLQEYIKEFDFNPADKSAYFLKLSEEMGELAEAMRKDQRLHDTGSIKGTIEEELCDVLYYVIALANVYGIDLEESFRLKDEINKLKWNR
ncbi:MAG TPA: MazG nucleotide pyrophosphohydrolase domain-containing protein [Bacillales bacterium]|nr:MazG nucleotide pyrophosphohydrolase domain-containing protein [Bacillales bacterium]